MVEREKSSNDFKAAFCGAEYHNIDGTGWPDAVVMENKGSVLDGTYESRMYYPERTCNNSYVGGCSVEFKCSACGEHCFYPKRGNGKYVKPRYCPSCGAKVVS